MAQLTCKEAHANRHTSHIGLEELDVSFDVVSLLVQVIKRLECPIESVMVHRGGQIEDIRYKVWCGSLYSVISDK